MNMLVIGSGPAGVACAKALLERGCFVTMLDAGLELEASKKEALIKFSSTRDYAIPRSFRRPLDSKNPIKLSYGSDYPYQEVGKHFLIEMDEFVHCLSSFARGGLSNVWGAFAETYTDQILKDWPISLMELEPYYEKIKTFLPIAYASEAKTQPTRKNTYQSSRQAKVLYSQMCVDQYELKQVGIEFAWPTLAVTFNECVYCSSCQYGCPDRLIYSAAHTLEALLLHKNFMYIPNMIVDEVKELEGQVCIKTYNRLTQEEKDFSSTQVFIACGPVISTYLIAKALNYYQQKIRLYDSSHFMFPCVMRKRVKNVSTEKLHTLVQLVLKVHAKEISIYPIHLQIYTYMDFYADKFKSLFKGLYPIAAFFLKPLLDRLIVIQGHLDSRESHQFNLESKKSELNKIYLSAVQDKAVLKKVKKLMRYLRQHSKKLGFIPIFKMLQISKIGKSFHYGASLPMRKEPQELETNQYGVPYGCHRIHVVDSSVFPFIPAGSITPTIMANAYRIGSECKLLEEKV